MQVSATKPAFNRDFKIALAKAVAKELTAEISEIDGGIFVTVFSQTRPVGKFTFVKKDSKLILTKKFIIEHDYTSLEFCVAKVVKYKMKGIKYISW